MNEIPTKTGINRRRFVMAGLAFLATLYFPRTAGDLTHAGKPYPLGDGYFSVNGWVVNVEDLA